jgi:probable rRNA maturation factor
MITAGLPAFVHGHSSFEVPNGRFAYHPNRPGDRYDAAPRTMILVDPNLDPDPTPQSSATGASTRAARLPSVRTLAQFLSQAQAVVRLHGEVSVLLTTDKKIRELNSHFRGKNKATDVLSFPAERNPGNGPEKVAGDLAISVNVARRQAEEQGHALGVEIKVLMLHGLLHLAGYDHETDNGQMARRERQLRARLRLPQGLIERVVVPQARRKNKNAPNLGHPMSARRRRP